MRDRLREWVVVGVVVVACPEVPTPQPVPRAITPTTTVHIQTRICLLPLRCPAQAGRFIHRHVTMFPPHLLARSPPRPPPPPLPSLKVAGVCLTHPLRRAEDPDPPRPPLLLFTPVACPQRQPPPPQQTQVHTVVVPVPRAVPIKIKKRARRRMSHSTLIYRTVMMMRKIASLCHPVHARCVFLCFILLASL